MGQQRPQAVERGAVAGWTARLDEVTARIGPRCARAEPRQRVRASLEGRLSSVERKTGWQRAERAGEAMPYGMPRLLAGAR